VKEKPNSVIAKVWNWDKKWQVKWYEDGAAKGAMQRFNGYDPDYLEYVGRLKTEKYTQPQESFFYFEATPSEKAREIEIEVTDRFGHIFPRQKVVLLPDK
jgi:molybdopterin synthase catalytic subunit